MSDSHLCVFAPTFNRVIDLSERVTAELFRMEIDSVNDAITEAHEKGFGEFAILTLTHDGRAATYPQHVLVRLQHSYTDDEVTFIDSGNFTAWFLETLMAYINDRMLSDYIVLQMRVYGHDVPAMLDEFTAGGYVPDYADNGALNEPAVPEVSSDTRVTFSVDINDPMADVRMVEFTDEFFSRRVKVRQCKEQEEAVKGRLTPESTFPLFVDADTEVALYIGPQVQNDAEYDGYLQIMNRVTPNAVGQTTQTYFAVVEGMITKENSGALRVAAQDYVDRFLLPSATLVDVVLRSSDQVATQDTQGNPLPAEDNPAVPDTAAVPERTLEETIAAEEASGVFRIQTNQE